MSCWASLLLTLNKNNAKEIILDGQQSLSIHSDLSRVQAQNKNLHRNKEQG